MPKRVWGIDISKTSIKAVQVQLDRDSLTVTALDVEELPRGGTDQAQIEAHVRDGLAKLAARNRLKGQAIACSLPGHAVFNRPVKLPPGDASRITERVRYEAQQQIPFPLNEVIWDSYVVDRKYEVGEEMEVILFAIKRDVVDHFIAILKEVDLQPSVIQFSPVALFNYLVYDQDPGTAAIGLDIGADNTDLIVLDGPRCWIRNLPITGNDLTKAIHKELGVPLAEAERLKITAPQSNEVGKIFASIQPTLKDLVGEIHRSIGYYKSISRLNKFDKVFLLGNGSKAIHLSRFISQNLQLEPAKLQALTKISVGTDVDHNLLQNYLETLGPALGLAIQGHGLSRMTINLLPEEERMRREAARRQPTAALAVLLLAAPVYLMWSSIHAERLTVEKAVGAANAVKQRHEKLKVARKEAMDPIPAFVNELNTVGNLVWERDLPLKVLDQVNKIVKNNTDDVPPPERFWLLRWEIQVKPPGVAAGPSHVERALSWLAPSASVQRLEVEGAIIGPPLRTDTKQAFDFVFQRLMQRIKTAFNTDGVLAVANDTITELKPASMRTGEKPLFPTEGGTKYYTFTASWEFKIGEEARKTAALAPAKK